MDMFPRTKRIVGAKRYWPVGRNYPVSFQDKFAYRQHAHPHIHLRIVLLITSISAARRPMIMPATLESMPKWTMLHVVKVVRTTTTLHATLHRATTFRLELT